MLCINTTVQEVIFWYTAHKTTVEPRGRESLEAAQPHSVRLSIHPTCPDLHVIILSIEVSFFISILYRKKLKRILDCHGEVHPSGSTSTSTMVVFENPVWKHNRPGRIKWGWYRGQICMMLLGWLWRQTLLTLRLLSLGLLSVHQNSAGKPTKLPNNKD